MDLLADGLDPRPDLVQDHRAWVVLLQTAQELYPNDRNILKTLDGFRCLGAELVVTGNGTLRMMPSKEQPKEEHEADRARYLMPIEKELRAVFLEASTRWAKEARSEG